MSFNFLNQLPSPEEIKKEYPLPEKLAQIKKNGMLQFVKS